MGGDEGEGVKFLNKKTFPLTLALSHKGRGSFLNIKALAC